MKYLSLPAALVCALIALPHAVQAQSSDNVIRNPCERGPVPTLKIINHNRHVFAVRLTEIRPDIPYGIAAQIAFKVCDDLGMLYDSDALTRRTNQLIRDAGY